MKNFEMKNEGLINSDNHHRYRLHLEESKQYMRLIYKQELKTSSTVVDHCVSYALSDKTDSAFRSNCNEGDLSHVHDSVCLRCEMVKISLEEVKDVLKEQNALAIRAGNKELMLKLENRLYDTEKAFEDIWAWKRHIVRAYWTHKNRQEHISHLTSNTALVIIDFAQKFLRTKHHETQSDYFGKQGFSWHLTHVITKIDNNYAQHTLVHFLKNSDQVKIFIGSNNENLGW